MTGGSGDAGLSQQGFQDRRKTSPRWRRRKSRSLRRFGGFPTHAFLPCSAWSQSGRRPGRALLPKPWAAPPVARTIAGKRLHVRAVRRGRRAVDASRLRKSHSQKYELRRYPGYLPGGVVTAGGCAGVWVDGVGFEVITKFSPQRPLSLGTARGCLSHSSSSQSCPHSL